MYRTEQAGMQIVIRRIKLAVIIQQLSKAQRANRAVIRA